MNFNNKWIRAAIPALLIHCSIGTVYCWSTIREAIAEQIGVSNFATGWVFSLAIFFLGTSAAFAGRFVEQNIHLSSFVAFCCFTLGMFGTGWTLLNFTGTTALILLYIFYGCILGIGLGVGYLTPVKTLMLWFKEQKGLATGISIMGFGLAKVMATPLMEYLQNKRGIAGMFIVLGWVYAVMMFAGHLLLRKPDGWIEPMQEQNNFHIKELLREPKFIMIWLMFFINIHCGLMLISNEKQLIGAIFPAVAVMIIPSITAACNALGRIGYSTISDYMDTRIEVYRKIFQSCQYIALLTWCVYVTVNTNLVLQIFTVALLMIVNLGYGGGFSTLPTLLEEHFGMENISKIHGIALTAWAVAGITGNNTAEIIKQHYDFAYVMLLAVIMYFIAYLISNRRNLWIPKSQK